MKMLNPKPTIDLIRSNSKEPSNDENVRVIQGQGSNLNGIGSNILKVQKRVVATNISTIPIFLNSKPSPSVSQVAKRNLRPLTGETVVYRKILPNYHLTGNKLPLQLRTKILQTTTINQNLKGFMKTEISQENNHLNAEKPPISKTPASTYTIQYNTKQTDQNHHAPPKLLPNVKLIKAPKKIELNLTDSEMVKEDDVRATKSIQHQKVQTETTKLSQASIFQSKDAAKKIYFVPSSYLNLRNDIVKGLTINLNLQSKPIKLIPNISNNQLNFNENTQSTKENDFKRPVTNVIKVVNVSSLLTKITPTIPKITNSPLVASFEHHNMGYCESLGTSSTAQIKRRPENVYLDDKPVLKIRKLDVELRKETDQDQIETESIISNRYLVVCDVCENTGPNFTKCQKCGFVFNGELKIIRGPSTEEEPNICLNRVDVDRFPDHYTVLMEFYTKLTQNPTATPKCSAAGLSAMCTKNAVYFSCRTIKIGGFTLSNNKMTGFSSVGFQMSVPKHLRSVSTHAVLTVNITDVSKILLNQELKVIVIFVKPAYGAAIDQELKIKEFYHFPNVNPVSRDLMHSKLLLHLDNMPNDLLKLMMEVFSPLVLEEINLPVAKIFLKNKAK